MSLRIKDTDSIPTGQWRYLVPATNFLVIAPNWIALYPKIVQHCQTNEIQPPSEQSVLDWCCANLDTICYDAQTHEPLINKWFQGISTPLAGGCCGSKK